MKSVFQKERICYLCGRQAGDLASHHIFYGAGRRKVSEKHGLKIWLCNHNCHLYGTGAVHRNPIFRQATEIMAQEYYEKNIGTREQFRKEFGKSYL